MSQMKQYHALLQCILETGIYQLNERTRQNCWMIPAAMMQFDLRESFPAITTKQLFFGQVKGELCGFMRGATSAAEFRALGCRIWDANANETPGWLANPNRKGEDDLGRIYGAQWTDWEGPAHFAHDYDSATGGKLEGEGEYVPGNRINQLEGALRTLRNDPSNRRVIITAWNPGELDRMALPPCHVLYQFVADVKNRLLHMSMYQRSCDTFLGVPFNIASSALLLSIMARLSGFTAGVFTHFLTDVHIYDNHREQVLLQLERKHLPAPALALDLKPVSGDDEIKGAFRQIDPSQIQLLNYRSHDPIRAAMAA